MNDPEPTSRWSVKELAKRGLFRAVKNDTIWALLKRTVLPFSRYAEHARHTTWPVPNWDRVMQEAIKATFPDLVVRHGVFKGMRYPEARSSGSALYPKLLGSYERELEPILETICQRPYGQVVDVGCAEGYYAVGLAMRMPSARVYAYDTNAEAIRLCRQLAQANNVENRVITGAFCDRETLRSIPFTGRGKAGRKLKGD